MTVATESRRSHLAKKEAYRQVVVDCAEELFARSGVVSTRVEEIAAAAGIAPRTLYSVFEGKQEIVDEVCERRRVAMVSAATERAAAAASPFGALVASVRASTEFFLSHPNFLRIELYEGLVWWDEKSSRSITWYEAFRGFVSLFSRCIDDGSVRPGDPRAYARAIIAIQQSQLGHWVAEGMADDHEVVVDTIEALVVNAFAQAGRPDSRGR